MYNHFNWNIIIMLSRDFKLRWLLEIRSLPYNDNSNISQYCINLPNVIAIQNNIILISVMIPNQTKLPCQFFLNDAIFHSFFQVFQTKYIFMLVSLFLYDFISNQLQNLVYPIYAFHFKHSIMWYLQLNVVKLLIKW